MKTNDKDNTNDTAITTNDDVLQFDSISNQQAVTITGEKGVDQEIKFHWTELSTLDIKLFDKDFDKEEVKVNGELVTRVKEAFRSTNPQRKYSRIYDENRIKIVFVGTITDELFEEMSIFHTPLEGTELENFESTGVERVQVLNPDKPIESNCTFLSSRLYQVIDQEIDSKIQKYRVSVGHERVVVDGKSISRECNFSYINLRTMFQPTNRMPVMDNIDMFKKQ